MYIVNSTELISLLQKQWRTVSFSAITADAGYTVGMSKEAVQAMHQNLKSEHSFNVSWPRYIIPAMSSGKDLDDLNRRAIEVLAGDLRSLRAAGSAKLGLSQWSRQIMAATTAEDVWGPRNPYRDPVVAEAWR